MLFHRTTLLLVGLLAVLVCLIIVLGVLLVSLFSNQSEQDSDDEESGADEDNSQAYRARQSGHILHDGRLSALQPTQIPLQEDEEQSSKTKPPRIVISGGSNYEPEVLESIPPFPIPAAGSSRHDGGYLILGFLAHQKLKKSLDWGKRTRRNVVEQGGILLGRAMRYRGTFYSLAEDILFAQTEGTPAFVELTHSMWAEMQNSLGKINAARSSQDRLVIIGWFHTHPNGLDVFMSGTDMHTQRLNFSADWQVSLVMNPHRNKYRVFFGSDAVEGRLVILEK